MFCVVFVRNFVCMRILVCARSCASVGVGAGVC